MSWLLELDNALAFHLNAYAHRSEFLDRLAVFASGNDFIKGGIPAAIFVWLWFEREPQRSVNRAKLVSVCLGAIIAVALSQLMQQALPFRLRPIHDPALNLTLNYGADPQMLAHWSSLPSDHAVLFGAISTGLFWTSKRAGLLAWFWTLAVILVPRLFIGLHFLSDILAGLGAGILIMAMTICLKPYLGNLTSFCLRMEEIRPSLFYAASLLFMWQLNTAFNEFHTGLRVAMALIQDGSTGKDVATCHPMERNNGYVIASHRCEN